MNALFFCVARENLRPRHAVKFPMPYAWRGVKNFCAGGRRQNVIFCQNSTNLTYTPQILHFCVFVFLWNQVCVPIIYIIINKWFICWFNKVYPNSFSVFRLQKHKNTKNRGPMAFLRKWIQGSFFYFVELKRLSIFAIEFTQIKTQISHVNNFRAFEQNQ